MSKMHYCITIVGATDKGRLTDLLRDLIPNASVSPYLDGGEFELPLFGNERFGSVKLSIRELEKDAPK